MAPAIASITVDATVIATDSKMNKNVDKSVVIISVSPPPRHF